jgi:uncharacterized protein (TIGR03000 family)
MFIRLWLRRGAAVGLGLVALLLIPTTVTAQVGQSRIAASYDVAGYSPRMYSYYATVGPPSYLTSTSYPAIYGRWTYGHAVITHGLYTGLPAPYTNYPETYTPRSAPVASTNVPTEYYLTGARPELGTGTLVMPQNVSMATLSALAPATIDIEVPETAEVYIQGRLMSQRGTLRRFVSPQLNPGLAYSYDVVAVWHEGDQDVRRVQRTVVRAGEYAKMSFVPTSGEPASPTLRSTGDTLLPPSGTAGPSTLPSIGTRK